MEHCLTLKKSNCKNCHKCIRHCPVKSIKFSGNQANIIPEQCILCGTCFVVCPQNAKEIVSEISRVKVLLAGDDPVVASIAPSFIANYDGKGISAIRKAIKELGFYDVEETAIGATIVKNDFDRLIEEEKQSVIISSCCHSVNLLIQKHFPDLIHCLASTVSPMQAHCLDIKRRIPNAKTVFIGPCVAKKDEAHRYEDIVDAALTFEEFSELLAESGIEIEDIKDENEESKARLFPIPGGVLHTMKKQTSKYTFMAVDSVPNCVAALEDIRKGNISDCFIEMNACAGACTNGPVMEKYHMNLVRDYLSVYRYAGNRDFPVEQPEPVSVTRIYQDLSKHEYVPTEAQISAILNKMGKKAPEDELNCGSCGYNTCREKAIAVYQGKAEIEMCLPFLRDRADNFSNIIFDNTPEGIVVLNDSFEIQMINPAARQIMNIRNARDVMGEQVITILDPRPFMDCLDLKTNIEKKDYLADYDKYVKETILYDESYHLLLCILQDITESTKAEKNKAAIREQTMKTADKVVDKQMRIVQEIASLLGETAADTKIALTHLKDSMMDQDE